MNYKHSWPRLIWHAWDINRIQGSSNRYHDTNRALSFTYPSCLLSSMIVLYSQHPLLCGCPLKPFLCACALSLSLYPHLFPFMKYSYLHREHNNGISLTPAQGSNSLLTRMLISGQYLANNPSCHISMKGGEVPFWLDKVHTQWKMEGFEWCPWQKWKIATLKPDLPYNNSLSLSAPYKSFINHPSIKLMTRSRSVASC